MVILSLASFTFSGSKIVTYNTYEAYVTMATYIMSRLAGPYAYLPTDINGFSPLFFFTG
jgi:hypothetical protein